MDITTKTSEIAAHSTAWFVVGTGIFTLHDIATMIGIALGIITCSVNIVFRYLEYKRNGKVKNGA